MKLGLSRRAEIAAFAAKHRHGGDAGEAPHVDFVSGSLTDAPALVAGNRDIEHIAAISRFREVSMLGSGAVVGAPGDGLLGIRTKRGLVDAVARAFVASAWTRCGERLPALRLVVLFHNLGAATRASGRLPDRPS
jgi:hypothetical protein